MVELVIADDESVYNSLKQYDHDNNEREFTEVPLHLFTRRTCSPRSVSIPGPTTEQTLSEVTPFYKAKALS
jgi:hypothetical protein